MCISSVCGDDRRSDPSIWSDYMPSAWESYLVWMGKLGGDIDRATYDELVQGPCAYCARSVPSGIDRVDNDVGYFVNNCVPCCVGCNYAKGREDVDAFLSRMDSIAERHIKTPELLASIGQVATNLSSFRRGVSTSSAPDRKPVGTTILPEDNVAFWAQLDRRGAGKTTVFVRAAALRPYVDEVDLNTFISELGNNIRVAKSLTYADSGEKELYVLMARAAKRFPTMPWPKACTACGAVKSLQSFPKSCTTCNDCGGSAARCKAAHRRTHANQESRARDAARKASQRARARGEQFPTSCTACKGCGGRTVGSGSVSREMRLAAERERMRRRRKVATEEDRAKEAARKAASRAEKRVVS